jgi:hypothetical protein
LYHFFTNSSGHPARWLEKNAPFLSVTHSLFQKPSVNFIRNCCLLTGFYSATIQGDQIGRIFAQWVIAYFLAETFEQKYVTYLSYFIPWTRLSIKCDQNWFWATFWAMFSQTHLVTLPPFHRCLTNCTDAAGQGCVQSDQIGKFFSRRTIVYFRQFVLKIKTIFWAALSTVKLCNNCNKNWIGLRFGRLFFIYSSGHTVMHSSISFDCFNLGKLLELFAIPTLLPSPPFYCPCSSSTILLCF